MGFVINPVLNIKGQGTNMLKHVLTFAMDLLNETEFTGYQVDYQNELIHLFLLEPDELPENYNDLSLPAGIHHSIMLPIITEVLGEFNLPAYDDTNEYRNPYDRESDDNDDEGWRLFYVEELDAITITKSAFWIGD